MTIPLSSREIKPHVHATRITGTRMDGLPDGVHTGGCWLCPDDTVWKPLVGRPWANATELVPTKERECLEAMSDVPLFPKNWEIRMACGMEWLVRRKAAILGRDVDHAAIDMLDGLQVEQSVRELNRRGWELNDPISLGYIDEWFVVDLSSAWHLSGQGIYQANDENRIYQFWGWCGLHNLTDLRKNARTARHEWWLKGMTARSAHEHVYASFNRPIDRMLATLPEGVELKQNDRGNWQAMIPWTWLFSTKPLDAELCDRYELVWGWSPVHPREIRIQK